jgi:hypothetical protein
MSNTATDDAIYHNGRTYAEHSAWLDSLTGNEWRMVYTPSGHLQNLAYIAYFKHALLNFKLTADFQLKLLEHINSCVYGLVTAEAVAAIEPSCDVGAEMLSELNKVPRSEVSRAFREGDVFRLLAKLNPSLLRALELCQFNGSVPEKRSA